MGQLTEKQKQKRAVFVAETMKKIGFKETEKMLKDPVQLRIINALMASGGQK